MAAAPALPAGAASRPAFSAPVYAGDFPDPYVLRTGGRYWAYSTGSAGRNLQVMSSPDLKSWSGPTEALPRLPAWASSGLTWAPGVIERSGLFVMYYTVHDPTLGQQCLSVATASSAGGPYTDHSSRPLICQVADGGSIDPNPYVDPASGRLYLLWKSDDNSIGQPSHLWIQRLVSSGRAWYPGTAPTQLLTESAAWQSPTIEGPAIIRHHGVYYLFYGANSYNSASSGIGYATSTSLLGPFANQSTNAPWFGTTGQAQGPQGPGLFVDSSGVERMAFAAWDGPVGYQNGGVRSLWIGTLGFNSSGVPTLH
jgi:beta-xylosidase